MLTLIKFFAKCIAACGAAAFALQGCGGATPPLGGVSGFTVVNEIRVQHAPEHSRFVFEMNRRATFKVLTLKNPSRVVIDLPGVELESALPRDASTGQFIRKIRHGMRGDSMRLVFDLAKPVRFYPQMLKPSGRYQYRLVADFHSPKKARVATTAPKPRKRGSTDVLVLIDPGHGGDDPGAVGNRTYEKHVVLQIAKKLKKAIDREKGMRARLTRNGDYYISLRRRTDIARRYGADIFISIHADAFKKKTARGASVYALSSRGASSTAAKWLADKENASDLVGGVSLADADDFVAATILDMSLDETVPTSIELGREVLAQLKKVGRLHSKRVEKAGFAVLKAPDIPSILVETAYISNPGEEKLLMNSRHQSRIAAAITAGVKRHIIKNRNRYAKR